MNGNCLTYAIGMYFAEGCTGRIKPGLLRGWPPKLRFFYVSSEGQRTHFFPDKPKRGMAVCLHALWFKGHVRKG